MFYMCQVGYLLSDKLNEISSFSLLWLPVTTPCGHVFCRECLIRSVDNTQALCPICKTSIEEVII
jgi:hypothetical protein